MKHRWETPLAWLVEKAGEPGFDLYNEFVAIASKLDNDTLQDLYQSEMAADGYFQPVEYVVTCSLCHNDANADKAHLHQGGWIGDECCWDERLRASE